MKPGTSFDDLEAVVNAQSEQINKLTGDLGVMMEQVNKLVGRLSPHQQTKAAKDQTPPAYYPAPSDSTQILQLMIAAEDRGSTRTMEMFERVGAIMGSMQDSLIKGMEMNAKQRSAHFDEFKTMAEEFTPNDDETEPNVLEGLGEAFELGEKLKAMIQAKKSAGEPPIMPVPGSNAHEG